MIRKFAAIASLAISAPLCAQINPPRPYVGVVAAHHDFDRNGPSGGSAGVVVGIDSDISTTPLFFGVEATAAQGSDDLDAEYGAVATFGTRAQLGGPWKLFARAGIHRVDFDRADPRHGRRENGLIVGLGADYAPFRSRPGLAFRASVDTVEFNSTRFAGGLVLRFNGF